MPEKDIQSILNEIVRRLSENTRRLRTLEDRSSLLEGRIGSLQDNVIRLNEKIRDNFKTDEGSKKDNDVQLMKIENDLNKLSKQIERLARKSELKELENLIELFNPLKQTFITKKQLNRILEQR